MPDPGSPPQTSTDAVTRERDLYGALLELALSDGDVGGWLRGILDALSAATGADRLYVQAGPDLDGIPPYWASIGASATQLDEARAHLSRTILREALRRGDVVETACALEDQRFDGAASVRDNRVGAVICAALGDDPTLGVLYVQGARGGSGLHRDTARLVALAARAIAPGLAREVARARLRADADTDATGAVRTRFPCPSIVGRSQALADVLELGALAAESDVPVLLTGASGTGKSALARAIAEGSRRARKPFVELNCAALPGELIESELFGAARGAHSTAHEARGGLVAAAEGGTLFLDEIAELPPAAQAKLLQFAQTGQYHRLGDASPRRGDVRLIAATNAAVHPGRGDGKLRADLYYRLAVVEIAMPSLAERPADVPDLAVALLRELAREHGAPPIEATPTALAWLRDRPFPGQVRELRNLLSLAVLRVRADGSRRLDVRHLDPTTRGAPGDSPRTLQATIRDAQRRAIEQALADAGGRAPAAAEALGVSRSHLYHLIASLGIGRVDAG